MTFIHRIVNFDNFRWAVTLEWIKSSLVLRFQFNCIIILFLRANFTSNTKRENQTFHQDENSSRLYSGGFSKLFGLTTFSGLFKQNYTTLDDILHYITLHNIIFKLTSHKKRRKCHWKCGSSLKFSEGDKVT